MDDAINCYSHCRTSKHKPKYLTVEREESRLGTPVIDITGLRGKRSQTSDVDNMTVVSSYHNRQEVLHKQYRCYHIYVEDFADLGLGTSEDGHGVADSGVVNENGRVSVFRDNVLGHFGDFNVVGKVC
jgi:hypothetical protein